MGYIIAFFFIFAFYAALLSAGLFLAWFAVAIASAFGFVLAVAEFASSSVRGFGGRAPLDNLQILPEPNGVPAYRSYYQGPVVHEFGNVVRASGKAVSTRISTWISGSWALVTQYDSTAWMVFAVLPAIGTIVGLVVGGALGAVVLFVVAAVAATLIGTLVLFGLLLGLALKIVELVTLSIRGITLECPGCRQRVARPIYRCSGEHGCDAAHSGLTPGRYGVLFRVCRCGRSLPTLLLLGKLNLASQCPQCSYVLPLRGMSAPTLHVPVAGGPQAGKSVFMFAAVKRLYDGVDGENSESDFWADPRFAATFARTQASVASPELMRKTTEDRPNAYNVYLGRGAKRRLMYLYDTAGEIYDAEGRLSEADFFHLTEGIVLCIDPFSLPGPRRSISADFRVHVRSSPSDPKKVLERLTENLREVNPRRSAGKLSVKVAVVITKADAFGPAGIRHPYSELTTNSSSNERSQRDEAVRRWIAEVGVRPDLVASLLSNFSTVSFFVVSHADAAFAGREPHRAVNDDPADPIQWILNRGAFR
ncbi:hypothetical protein ACFFOM_13710 [Microlunatus capsulatus]|uniref:Double-GTPase 2 domain-containing protein n=1 Tax=Microlunatus capsulatus TaxID=99117 RepID=A0ABS4Z819_9ACTN|nr:hypothetical protein [Microlunatus capsulatus]MBP2417197.1 hypothetical protein [Microlunatus capsulatus]